MTYCYKLHALCKDHSAPNTYVLVALRLLGLNVQMDHCQSLLINRYHFTGHYQSSVEAASYYQWHTCLASVGWVASKLHSFAVRYPTQLAEYLSIAGLDAVDLLPVSYSDEYRYIS